LQIQVYSRIIHAMPRIARIIAAGYPHHITQRGNNRATVFFDDEDRLTYLKLLSGYTQKYQISILAYCLMDNHIHLLAVPETETALARGIGLTNLMYTQYLNRKFKQSGRIWQNRFFSCIVENDTYLWSAARYIERNPLKAALAANAELYRWSSAKAHITGTNDPLLDATSWLSPQERSAYAEFVRDEDEETDNAIRRATRTGRPYGTDQFIDHLEFQLNQPVKPGKPGRPRKTGKCP
jgi:putative transposase